MAIVEIGSEVYNIPEQVASKILDMSFKIEELEMEVAKLKKDVLDGEIHWHSQKQKRLAEKRKKLKYKQRINEAIEYIGNGNLGIPRKTREKFIKILKGEE